MVLFNLADLTYKKTLTEVSKPYCHITEAFFLQHLLAPKKQAARATARSAKLLCGGLTPAAL